jgi:hypothetical protein
MFRVGQAGQRKASWRSQRNHPRDLCGNPFRVIAGTFCNQGEVRRAVVATLDLTGRLSAFRGVARAAPCASMPVCRVAPDVGARRGRDSHTS